jgi:hypothetical protein
LAFETWTHPERGLSWTRLGMVGGSESRWESGS